MGLLERFFAFVPERPVHDPDACWLWTGSVGSHGYGQLHHEGRPVSAPRTMLGITIGRSLTAGEMALHRCDVKRCVRPSHLYAGDAKQNAADAVARGQHYKQPRRTHCGQGHLLSPFHDRQICTTCHRESQRRRRGLARRPS